MDRSANIYSRFFLHIVDCKVLNQRKLYDSAILRGLQNIVKEGLTRKIFATKNLAMRYCDIRDAPINVGTAAIGVHRANLDVASSTGQPRAAVPT